MAAMEAAELVLDRMSLSNGGKGGLLVNTASLAGVVDGLTKIFSTLIFFSQSQQSLVSRNCSWVGERHPQLLCLQARGCYHDFDDDDDMMVIGWLILPRLSA